MKLKPAHIYAIRWQDCRSLSGWYEAKDFKGSLAPMLAVGLYVCHDKETITIAPMYSDSGQCSDPITIPRSQILSLQYCKLLVDVKADERKRGKIRLYPKRKWRIK